MRVLALALAILLLPLRGWLGDGMATAMAVEAVQSSAADRSHTAAEDHSTHDMAGMAHDGHADDAQHGDPDCHGTCTDCQLCHSVAMTLWPESAAAIAAPHVTPAFAPAAFASAEPARGLKPPIS